MIFISKYLVPHGFNGISIFPFVFIKHGALKTNRMFMNHEKIHLRQQLELLIIFFYLWYILEFIFRYFQHKNWDKAYRNISFEREAYANENDLNYLESRPFLRAFKYF